MPVFCFMEGGRLSGYPPGRDPRNRGDFRLRLRGVQILLCLIRKNACPFFQPKAKTTPDGTIRPKTAPKTCPYRPLWTADPMPRRVEHWVGNGGGRGEGGWLGVLKEVGIVKADNEKCNRSAMPYAQNASPRRVLRFELTGLVVLLIYCSPSS